MNIERARLLMDALQRAIENAEDAGLDSVDILGSALDADDFARAELISAIEDAQRAD